MLRRTAFAFFDDCSSNRKGLSFGQLRQGFHIMKKSRYSGMFGDYSSYSSEYDELNEGPEEGIEDEE